MAGRPDSSGETPRKRKPRSVEKPPAKYRSKIGVLSPLTPIRAGQAQHVAARSRRAARRA